MIWPQVNDERIAAAKYRQDHIAVNQKPQIECTHSLQLKQTTLLHTNFPYMDWYQNSSIYSIKTGRQVIHNTINLLTVSSSTPSGDIKYMA